MNAIPVKASKDIHIQEWQIKWITDFLSESEKSLQLEHAIVTNSNDRHMTFRIYARENPAAIIINVAKTTNPIKKSEDFIAWYNSERQQYLFEKHKNRIKQNIISKFTCLAAAPYINKSDFERLYQHVVNFSYCNFIHDQPNLSIGVGKVPYNSEIDFVERGNGNCGLIINNPKFRIKNQTFTPRIDMILPDSLRQGCVGRRLCEITDLPMFQDEDIFIERVACQGGGGGLHKAPNRVSFTICEDNISLEEGLKIIENTRQKLNIEG